jgi:hypothetical protein
MLIEASLSDAARKAIDMEWTGPHYFNAAQKRNWDNGVATGVARGEAKGKAAGEATALLKILARRGLTTTAAQRRRILGCTDLATLERWLDRSLSVSSVGELLASRVRRTRAAGRGMRAASRVKRTRVAGRREQAAPVNGRRKAR